jgi:hypothetical protein
MERYPGAVKDHIVAADCAMLRCGMKLDSAA